MNEPKTLRELSCADDYDPDSMLVDRARELIRTFLVPVTATERGLSIEGADEATLIVSAGTDWIDKGFASLARRRLDAALAKSSDAIRDGGVADHRRYMERVKLTLPEGPNSIWEFLRTESGDTLHRNDNDRWYDASKANGNASSAP